ncbi:opine metallophore biosynthesis dehydrogenase [Paenibacillus sp. PL2-23]|uniref:opine metallophore biosynthesis dehydrogenase n=1 Tax=Paenibacillus sp. PL2-23 TaxID=2100729 RepID=UPI0030F86EDF
MHQSHRMLLAGTGPASVQLAVSLHAELNAEIGIAGRRSARSQPFFASLSQTGGLLRASVQNEKHSRLEGECLASRVYEGYDTVDGIWDMLILAVTTDAYLEVLKQLSSSVIRGLQSVVLVSPTFGSSRLVSGYLESLQSKAEVISCSTYIGDTRWLHGEPSGQVLTAGVKRKIFIGSTCASSEQATRLAEAFQRLGIGVTQTATPIEAEARNISLYVHPPLFMNDFSLDAVFGQPAKARKYVYKLYPEGPITQELIRDMLAQWKEITSILAALGVDGVNLLRFMTDDNYPVRPESLSRRDIEEFVGLEPIHQEYLLYIRYASLLIDPFSTPDEQGRYYDFSAVPFRALFVNLEGELDIPRMPKEDYYRLKIIQGIARHLQVACPTIDRFLSLYEAKLAEASGVGHDVPLSRAFQAQSFEEDLAIICKHIGGT